MITFEIKEVGSNNMTHTKKTDSAEKRLQSRLQHLRNACENIALDKNIHKQRNLEITLAQGRLKMCGLEKTASTFMKQLKGREKSEVKTSADRQNEEPQQKSEPKHDPENFKTFVIVREPYGRLVSAFIDKLYTRSLWWSNFGSYIIKKFRFQATNEMSECGSDVSFPEFIRYWIHALETDHRRDGHFDPMHRECQFCLFKYDYFVHLETLLSDMTYIYQSVNATLISTMDDEEDTIRDKAADIINQRQGGSFQKCEGSCDMLNRAWWSFHARGLIATDVQLPLSGDRCDTVTKHEFEDIAWQAHLQSADRIDKRKQRRDAIVELYLQVPILDRLKVRQIFLNDFKLHGYESTPSDLFPELNR